MLAMITITVTLWEQFMNVPVHYYYQYDFLVESIEDLTSQR